MKRLERFERTGFVVKLVRQSVAAQINSQITKILVAAVEQADERDLTGPVRVALWSTDCEAHGFAIEAISAFHAAERKNVLSGLQAGGATPTAGVVREIGVSLDGGKEQHLAGALGPAHPARHFVAAITGPVGAVNLQRKERGNDFRLAGQVVFAVGVGAVDFVVEVIVDAVFAVAFALCRLADWQILAMGVGAIDATVTVIVDTVFAVGLDLAQTGFMGEAVGIEAIDKAVAIVVEAVVTETFDIRTGAADHADALWIIAVDETVLVVIDAVVADFATTKRRTITTAVGTVDGPVPVVVDAVVADFAALPVIRDAGSATTGFGAGGGKHRYSQNTQKNEQLFHDLTPF